MSRERKGKKKRTPTDLIIMIKNERNDKETKENRGKKEKNTSKRKAMITTRRHTTE